MTLNDFARELEDIGNRMDKGLSQERTTMALHQLLVDLVDHLILINAREHIRTGRRDAPSITHPGDRGG